MSNRSHFTKWFAQESQAPSKSLEGHLPLTAEAGQQLAELEAQLEAEAGLKLQLLERVHHLESQVNMTCEPTPDPHCTGSCKSLELLRFTTRKGFMFSPSWVESRTDGWQLAFNDASSTSCSPTCVKSDATSIDPSIATGFAAECWVCLGEFWGKSH